MAQRINNLIQRNKQTQQKFAKKNYVKDNQLGESELFLKTLTQTKLEIKLNYFR